MKGSNFNQFSNSVKTELSETKYKMKDYFNRVLEKLGLGEEGIPDEKYTGLLDKHGEPIKIGDLVRLEMKDGTSRCFKVCFKTVKRKIYCHKVFDENTVDVYITGVVFCWNGYDLFPRCDENGASDTDLMELVKI